MDRQQLKFKILELTKEYFHEVHEKQSEFVPGRTRINYGGRFFNAEELVNLVDSSLDFWLTAGPWTRKFETKLSEWLGVEYCSLCNSGSSANLLAFSALTAHELGDRAIGRGDEVITVAAGFPTTIAAILQYNCVPVFVDMSFEEANIDCSQLEAAYSERTKAVMVAHTLGNPFNLQMVIDFCRKHDLWLIEDNCDALGSEYFIDGQWKKTGTIGDIGTSSFYPPHHITMGEGGAVYTNNRYLNKYVRSFRDWGRDCWCDSGVDNTCGCRFTKQFGELPIGYDHKYVYSHMGYNLKATDMQAAIGCAQLDKLDYIIRSRRENFEFLYSGLIGCRGLLLPCAQSNSKPSWFGFLLTVLPDAGYTRNELTGYLEENKIQTRNLFAGNIIRHPAFEQYKEGRDYRCVGDLPATTSLMNNSFWIGVYPGMTPEKLQYMVDTIKAFIASR